MNVLPPRAYITMLSTSDYLPGVAALSASLRRTRAACPLFVAITHGVDQKTAARAEQFASGIIRVPPVRNPAPGTTSTRWNQNYSKLQIFGLTQFEKIVFLDADMIVCANIDKLFERPHFSAVFPRGFESQESGHLNSGLMVIEPNADQHREILSLVGHLKPKRHGDQSFLHAYFPDWPQRRELHLEYGYNTLVSNLSRQEHEFGYRLPTEQEVVSGAPSDAKVFRVIHFVGGRKPWHLRRRAKHLLQTLNLGGKRIRTRANALWYRAEWDGRVSRRLQIGDYAHV